MLTKEKFLRRVVMGKCWNWKGAVNDNGYGTVSFRNQKWRAHRVSWLYFRGLIPRGKLVLHHCDNRRCVKPGHLFLGTYLDNHADMRRKGRQNYVGRDTSGHRNGMHVLTEEVVLEIRNLSSAGTSVRELAAKFGVTDTQIRNIVNRRAWVHV